jgi:hypothetical protein
LRIVAETSKSPVRWCVQVVATDPLLIERVRHHLSKKDSLEVLYTEGRRAEQRADVFILPVEMMAGLDGNSEDDTDSGPVSASPNTDCPNLRPVIAYGDARRLRSAFLLGAADYLKNPWSPEELWIRLERILQGWNARHRFPWGTLSIRSNRLHCKRQASADSLANVALSYQQRRILGALLKERGKPVSRGVLFQIVWGRTAPKGSRAVDVHVSSLNRKIRQIVGDEMKGRLVTSVRGYGYMIE